MSVCLSLCLSVLSVSVCRALCYLSVKQYRDAIRDCGEALMIDGSNIKALYRRAQAHKELKVRAPAFAASAGDFHTGQSGVGLQVMSVWGGGWGFVFLFFFVLILGWLAK